MIDEKYLFQASIVKTQLLDASCLNRLAAEIIAEMTAEIRRLRRIEEAAKEVAANEAEDIDSRLRYVSVQPGRDEWAALKAALCNRTE